jgi:hypothetical protein
MFEYLRLIFYLIIMQCIKIHFIYGTIKVIKDLSLNFSKSDNMTLNKFYWLPNFTNFVC